MTHVSLYRKWRPGSLAELVGQEHVSTTLSNAIASGNVSHAYLFSGPRGTGKTSTARILAKSLNCSEGPTVTPCDKCESCVDIAGGGAMDVIEIDAASNRGVDNARELRDQVFLASSGSHTKVYIIDEVHMLTTEASNTLLKILEEPPKHVVFVLATTEPERILPTIVSRCQRFDFRRIELEAMVERLAKVAEAEAIIAEEAVFALVAREARGGLRDALSILDQLSVYGENKLTVEKAATVLGLSTAEELHGILSGLCENDVPGIFKALDLMARRGAGFSQLALELLAYARDIYLMSHLEPSDALRTSLVQAAAGERAAMLEIGSRMGDERVRRLIDKLTEGHQRVRMSPDPRLTMEMILIGLCDSVVTNDVKAAEKPKSKRVSPRTERTTEQVSALPEVEAAWPKITTKLKSASFAAYLLLLEGRLVGVEGNNVRIGFAKEYHKQQMQKKETVATLRAILGEVLGRDMTIECVSTEQSDPVATTTPSAVDLLRDSFGAEVVEDH